MEERNNSVKQSLCQNYPNPFNLSTKIGYSIKGRLQAGHVTLKISDILGGEVATLVNEEQSDGNYRVEFSPDRYGLSSGIFICGLQTGKQFYRKK
jgi:hypothetical protein